MKSPLKKLRDFALRKHGIKTETAFECDYESCGTISMDATTYTQELKDIKKKYEGLSTNGQIICGAAYDFSRSLNDMASYMLEMFGETESAFGAMTQFQFEISKLLEALATHVSQTIIYQAEQIMTEIQHIQALGENAAESLTQPNALPVDGQRAEHLQRTEQSQGFYSHAKLFIQGEPNRMIEQAAKYHKGYMDFFSKGFAKVNAMEPKLKQLAKDNGLDRSVKLSEVANCNRTQIADVQQPKSVDNPSKDMLGHLESSTSSTVQKLKPIKVKTNSFQAPPLFPKKQNGKTFNRTTSDKVSMYALPSPFQMLAEQRNGTNSSPTQTDINESDLSPVKGYYSGNILEDYKTNQNSRASYHVKKPLYSVERNSRHMHSLSLDHFVTTQQNGSSTALPVPARSVTIERRFGDQSRRHSHSGSVDHSWRNSRTNENASPFTEGLIFPLSSSGPLSTTDTPTNFSVPQISELHKLPLPPSRTVSSSSLLVGNFSKETQNQLSPLPQPPFSNRQVTRSLSTPCQYDKP